MTIDNKIDLLIDKVNHQNVIMAKHIAHQEMHAELLKKHDRSIDLLDAHKNNLIGKQNIIAAAFGAASAFLIKLFTH